MRSRGGRGSRSKQGEGWVCKVKEREGGWVHGPFFDAHGCSRSLVPPGVKKVQAAGASCGKFEESSVQQIVMQPCVSKEYLGPFLKDYWM